MARGSNTWRVALVALVSLPLLCCTCAGVNYTVRATVARPFAIYGPAMAPEISPGDRIVATLRGSSISAGDIVVFSTPGGAGPVLVGRVVAVGGQEIDLRDGVVYVDGKRLDEPYVDGAPTLPLNPDITYPVTLSAGSVWVMGDNRTRSGDSREYGPLDLSVVIGRAYMTYWPPGRVGWF